MKEQKKETYERKTIRILNHPYRIYEFPMTDKEFESYKRNNPWADIK